MKKALLIGINRYVLSKATLRGCVNDITQMSATLTRYFKFNPANIRMLADERATKANIIDRIKWLVADAKPGDTLVLHFSGHGSLISLRDAYGKVLDPREPILCTYELNWDNPLTFREIGKLLAAPEGVNITSVLDSCHCGHDFKDLNQDVIPRFLPPPIDISYRDYSIATKAPVVIKLSEDTDIIMAACGLTQTSADAFINGTYRGAFTFCLNEAMASFKYKTDYVNAIAKTGLVLKNNRFSQMPQLFGATNKFSRWPIFDNPVASITQPAKKEMEDEKK